MNEFLRSEDNAVLGLLTDFGDRDGYVGVVKGVVLHFSPRVQIVDISHSISPQDIDEAAFVLLTTYRYFPENTLFAIIVDPGVGTDRRVIGVETEKYAFLAPDNGVLAPIFQREKLFRVFEITDKQFFLPEISATFHGRDIFAPVAGQYLSGLTFSEMGREIQDFDPGFFPIAQNLGDKISGQILHIDRFGNLISNIPVGWVQKLAEKKAVTVRVGEFQLKGMAETFYSESGRGLQAYPDSSGFIGFSIFKSSAAEMTGLKKGDLVEVF